MKTLHFDSLFDDFSIWQHADRTKPIKSEGYALDDATRGLLLCLSLNKIEKANVLFDYIVASKKGNELFGFATDTRRFINSPASEDAVGQIVWAFGYSAHIGHRQKEALEFIESINSNILSMKSLRGPVYALLGAIYTNEKLSKTIYKNIAERFNKLDKTWLWPEELITYGNGIVPYAILRYALIFNDNKAAKLGRDILEFLENICTNNRIRGPIGNDGWYKKGDKCPATYSQQPIDTSYMIWAWLCAYQSSHKKTDLDKAELWMQWFEGKNIANTIMYDKKTLGAYDGIDPVDPNRKNNKGINHHSGAETNICFLLSRWMIETEKTI